MSGCVYRDPLSDTQCMAPIANWKVKMCQNHAARGRGMHARKDFNQAIKPPVKAKVKDKTTFKKINSKSSLDIWEHPPANWRTTKCTQYFQGKPCRYGHTCSFAHSEEQLRSPTDPLPDIVYCPRIGEGDDPPSVDYDEDTKIENSQKELDNIRPNVQLPARDPQCNVPASKIEPELF